MNQDQVYALCCAVLSTVLNDLNNDDAQVRLEAVSWLESRAGRRLLEIIRRDPECVYEDLRPVLDAVKRGERPYLRVYNQAKTSCVKSRIQNV